jgi:hypothetical protein
METLHLHKLIESETLYLPELRPLIGKTVEIIVKPSAAENPPTEWLPGFWEVISMGWQGEPLVRPEQGLCERRDALE